MSVFDDFNMLGKTDPICYDPTCPRGRIGGWNYQFKDGPCDCLECQWPWQYLDYVGEWITIPHRAVEKWARAGHSIRRLPARPHFTDTPAAPIVDAGKAALGGRRP